MRADGINPRVGITVAFCSIFLIFGLMFSMSGTKGETLGPVPLIALGPAIFFPALAVIILANKTKGFRTWPWPWMRLQVCRGVCCAQRKEKNMLDWGSPEDLEGLNSTGGSTKSTLGGSLVSGKGEKSLKNLRDYCPSSGLKGALERPPNFSTMQHVCVGKSVPYTLTVTHTNGVVPFRDSFIMGSDALGGLSCYYENIRWGNETIV